PQNPKSLKELADDELAKTEAAAKKLGPAAQLYFRAQVTSE
ncbi:hypothetical protein CCACVL1_28420, partial [Corchorus capsularis]